MSRAVKFDRYGGTDVLDLVDVPDRPPGDGEVRVRVVTAGINPGEIGIRSGVMHDRFPATFPEGQGSDFAGVVAEVGAKVDGVSVGDEVIGFSDNRNAQAESVTLPVDRVIPKPHGVSWDEAGTAYVAGTTAFACVQSVGIRRGDVVVVAGAAGGVGVIATQLAVIAGAVVIATASRENHAFLESLGAIPIEYGKDLEKRIRATVPDGVDAFIDTHGDGNVAVAAALGVDAHRINTIIDFAAAAKFTTQANGMSTVTAHETMIELARLMSLGEVTIPIRAAYPIADVRAAYEELAKGHGLGKIVLEVTAAPR